jgi:hypothetical protein
MVATLPSTFSTTTNAPGAAVPCASDNVKISGTTLAPNVTGSDGVAIGVNTLEECTTGAHNTAVGVSTLATGTQNTAVGVNTLAECSTGAQNTAVGVNTLAECSTGAQNTAVGVNTLAECSTGAQNTAVGVNTLATGAQNTAVGVNTLATGAQNTAVGVNTLATGAQNTAVGVNTLAECSTGTQNTAVGVNTLAECTTGAHNTAVGVSTLERVTTGTQNTASDGASAPCFSYSPAIQALLCALTDGLKELLAALEHESIDEKCKEAIASIKTATPPYKVTREVVEHNNYQVLQVAAGGSMECLTAIHRAVTITPQMARSAKMLEVATRVGRLDVVRFLIETVGLGAEDVYAPDVLVLAVTNHDILVYLLRTVQCTDGTVMDIFGNTHNPAGLVARLARP